MTALLSYFQAGYELLAEIVPEIDALKVRIIGPSQSRRQPRVAVADVPGARCPVPRFRSPGRRGDCGGNDCGCGCQQRQLGTRVTARLPPLFFLLTMLQEWYHRTRPCAGHGTAPLPRIHPCSQPRLPFVSSVAP